MFMFMSIKINMWTKAIFHLTIHTYLHPKGHPNACRLIIKINKIRVSQSVQVLFSCWLQLH